MAPLPSDRKWDYTLNVPWVDQTAAISYSACVHKIFCSYLFFSWVPNWTSLLGSGAIEKKMGRFILPWKDKSWLEKINPPRLEQMCARVTLASWIANQQGAKVVAMSVHCKLICLCLCLCLCLCHCLFLWHCQSTGGPKWFWCPSAANWYPTFFTCLSLTFIWAPIGRYR